MSKLVLALLLCLNIIGNSYSSKQLTLFWGDNGKSEKRLRYYCDLNVYDNIILSRLSSNSKDTNPGTGSEDLPSLDFGDKCNTNPLAGKDYNKYLKCPTIEYDIRRCQSKGIKILLNVGGLKYLAFTSPEDAEQQALLWWNLFLGGDHPAKFRTFGSVKLDGINLNLNFGSQQANLIEFVREMRYIMDTKGTTNKQYLLTASPRCDTLSSNNHAMPLVPSLKQEPTNFDHLFIDSSYGLCSMENPKAFLNHFEQFVGLSRDTIKPRLHVALLSDATSERFVQPIQVQKIVNDVLSSYAKFEGLALDKASDQRTHGKLYNTLLRSVLDNKNYVIDGTTTTTTRKPKPPPRDTFHRYGAGVSIKSSLVIIMAAVFASFTFFPYILYL